MTHFICQTCKAIVVVGDAGWIGVGGLICRFCRAKDQKTNMKNPDSEKMQRDQR